MGLPILGAKVRRIDYARPRTKPREAVPSFRTIEPRVSPVTKRVARTAITLPTALAVAVPLLAPAATAQMRDAARPDAVRVSSALTRADYEACKAHDEEGFRRAVDAITLAALEKGLTGIDYRASVGDEWRRGDIDRVLAAEVDKAIDTIRSQTGFGEQISSLFSKETAQRLATDAAERVFRSDAIKKAIETLAVGVGREVGRRLELAIADASEPAARCVQAFLGPRYGGTIASVVGGDAARDFSLDATKATAEVSSTRVAFEGKEGIAGAVILIVRRQLANLAARIGQRLVGAVLSRVVAAVAGGIGVLLIAKDLWELRQGALPIIASEMKSAATRDKVQEEIARAIGEQIGEHVREISARSADRIVEVWHEFRRAHAKVVELAGRDDAFRRFVDAVSPRNLPRLDEIVGLVLAGEGEAGLLQRVADGSLHHAVERLPAPALTIARDTRSLSAALEWATLAGDRLPRVVEAELHRRNPPSEFSKASLARLLGLGERTATLRLASLKAGVREPLLELQDRELTGLARALDVADLESLSVYMTRLEPAAGKRLLAAVGTAPARMQAVAPAAVQQAILESRDQAAAVGLLLRGDTLFDVALFAADARLVADGRISWRVLWARYPAALTGLGVLGLVLLMAFWRVLFGRRPRHRGTPPAAEA